MTEKRLPLLACQVVGGLLVLESIAMLILALFFGVVGTLMGALAFGVGAGDATDKQLVQGVAVILLTLASPFVLAAVLAVGGVFLLLRRRKGIVVAAAVIAIAAQLTAHLYLGKGWSFAELLPFAVQLAAIFVAFAFVPAPAAPAVAS
jgi:hypothetical protein